MFTVLCKIVLWLFISELERPAVFIFNNNELSEVNPKSREPSVVTLINKLVFTVLQLIEKSLGPTE